jgi:hypothetical protein
VSTSPDDFQNPMGWPEACVPFFRRAISCEYATLTRAGQPLTYPITPHVGVDGRTLDVATGLAYPLKAERARNHPKVALLFSEPRGTGLTAPPTVLVYGEAQVLDADLQANTDRYVALSMKKFSAMSRKLPGFMHRRGGWYYARIWVRITPKKILTWPADARGEAPQVWTAPEGTRAVPSDPKPRGKSPGVVFDDPVDPRHGARYAAANLGAPVLTVVDTEGYPVPMRMASSESDGESFLLQPHGPLPAAPEGRACVTYHTHPEVFTGQENLVFTGEARREGDAVRVRIERQLGSFTLGRGAKETIKAALKQSKQIKKRLALEAARRGQPVPKVRLP